MEREIQVISPGALGNAMQPGQCPPPPAAAFVQNGKLLGGGVWKWAQTSSRHASCPQHCPEEEKSSSPSLAALPTGSPSYGTSGSPVVPGWAPAQWVPCGCQAPVLQGKISPACTGTVLGLAPPHRVQGRGPPLIQ